MDSRTALKKGTLLCFDNGCRYQISGELARGGSSIVYNACYTDNLGQKKTVRIKECYPFQCRLRREQDGSLIGSESDEALFESAKERMTRAYRLATRLFCTDGLTNLTANTYNIYEANHTKYVVLAYAQGQELTYDRYPSAADSIAVVKSVAEAVSRLHSRGYLYLDLKPGNVLTLEGTTELIQLFDFDTAIPIAEATGALTESDKISYTRGFAALEQQMGDRRRIGKHSDVYGVGALLFYMLFNRTPDAFDCETDAEYDFSVSKLAGNDLGEALPRKLTDFFHHTIADYYLDRYSNMETVTEKLSELRTLAGASARYIFSTSISGDRLCLGRKAEAAWIGEKLNEAEPACFFVTGMGGIGKSTLVRSCLKENREAIDTLLFLSCGTTVEKAITDEYLVHIQSVTRDPAESEQDYFDRKLRIMQELGKGKRCILVMDDFTGTDRGTMKKLRQLGWILIFIARDPSLAEGWPQLRLGEISDREVLLELFRQNMGRRLEESEREAVQSVISGVQGHTLLLELIAKQIGSPVCGLTAQKAAEIVRESGFMNLPREKMNYRKDMEIYHDTIRNIISGLFQTEQLTEDQRTVLKVLALFGAEGISVRQFCRMLEFSERENISLLYSRGWIRIEDTMITMHPVIRETVGSWNFSAAACKAADQSLRYLNEKLRKAAVLKCPQKIMDDGNSSICRNLWKQLRGMETGPERMKKAVPDEADEADPEEIAVCLRLAESAVENGAGSPVLSEMKIFRQLQYTVLVSIPYENEAYIEKQSEAYIAGFDGESKKELLEIYDGLLELLYERGDMEEGRKRLNEAKAAISTDPSPALRGQYYYMEAAFYDAALGGAYWTETEEEIQLRSRLLRALDRSIRFMSLAGGESAGLRLAECLRFKALVLIRSGLGNAGQIGAILKKVQKILNRFSRISARLTRDCYMTWAWYYTYVEENLEETRSALRGADEMTDRISRSDLDRIDDVLSPTANILFEWKLYEEAAEYLLRSVLICENHLEIPAYGRKQLELLGHLLAICFESGELDRCRAVIRILDERARMMGITDTEDYVPEELRAELLRV